MLCFCAEWFHSSLHGCSGESFRSGEISSCQWSEPESFNWGEELGRGGERSGGSYVPRVLSIWWELIGWFSKITLQEDSICCFSWCVVVVLNMQRLWSKRFTLLFSASAFSISILGPTMYVWKHSCCKMMCYVSNLNTIDNDDLWSSVTDIQQFGLCY